MKLISLENYKEGTREFKNKLLNIQVHDFSTSFGGNPSTSQISSTFNGWLYPCTKSVIKENILKIETLLTVSPSPLNVKCIIMDTNKNVLHTSYGVATSGEKIVFEVNFKKSNIPTENFLIGFVANDNSQETHLAVGGNSKKNILYDDFAKDIETAYTTTGGTSWVWINNIGNMNFKNNYYKIYSYDNTYPITNILSKLTKPLEINLFDKNAILGPGYLVATNDGRLYYYENALYCVSDFIEVKPNTIYSYSGGNANNVAFNYNLGIIFYDENKVFISSISSYNSQTPQSFTTPANCKYLLINLESVAAANTNVQLEEGASATSYKDYNKEQFYMENLLVSSSNVRNTNSIIKCDSKYNLVVGDTFELFYKGILNVYNYESYNVLCKCNIGNCFSRKFSIENIAQSAVGTHELTIEVYDNNEILLDAKKISLVVHNKTTSPANQKVILCMGDSLSAGGQWIDEFSRRLTTTTTQTSYGQTAPQGLGLSNITFIGKKTSVSGVRYEGYGGWTFGSYLSTSTPTMYWVVAENNGKTESDQESIWQDANGVQWQLETIEANRLKFKKYSGSGVMPSSGTLTWVSGGVNTNSITFTSSSIAEGNPFVYNGQIDFSSYCQDMNVQTIDEVYILLGWNNAVKTIPDMTNCKTFIGLLKDFNPNIKIILIGLQIPSLDGCGVNYGAKSIYAQYMTLVNYVHNLDSAYKEVANEYENVYTINLSGQFDTEYNMPSVATNPNFRNTTQIQMQNNGVHPSNSGYYQIADVAYRWFNGNN